MPPSPAKRKRGKTSRTQTDPTVSFRAKRGRPTSEQAAAISQTILAAATRLFTAEGYNGVTMEAVAAAAGVPKSTLYHRFKDKLTLLRAVLAERTAAWAEEQAISQPALPQDHHERLRARAAALLSWVGSSEFLAFARIGAAPSEAAHEVNEALHELWYLRTLDTFEADIRAYSEGEGRSAEDPRGVSRSLVALLTGWLVTARPGAEISHEERLAFAHKAVDILACGRQAW